MIWETGVLHLHLRLPDHENRISKLARARVDVAGEAGGTALNASALRRAWATLRRRARCTPVSRPTLWSVRSKSSGAPVRGTGRGGLGRRVTGGRWRCAPDASTGRSAAAR